MAGIDVVIALIAIIRGFGISDLSLIVSGAFCGLMAISSVQNISTVGLLMSVAGGVVGIGYIIQNGFRDIYD